MRSQKTRLLAALGWLALLFASLRPVAPVERALELAGAPLRAVAELALPLDWLRAGETRASEGAARAAGAEEAAASAACLAALARAAVPEDPALRAGRRLVHAEVVGRVPGRRDELVLRLPGPEGARGLAPGMPVACGDAYVGRLARVDAEAGSAEAVLVTARNAFVGARARDPRTGLPVDVIVGGLAPGAGGRSAAALRLAVHNPSDRALSGGTARVHERLPEEDAYAALAEGFRLGEVERARDGSPVVRPDLDFRSGLSRVVVLAPADPELPGELPLPRALADDAWRAANVLGHGDPTPWRETAVLARGSRGGVLPGAAVASGARLVGRVARALPWSAHVSGLGDPGFAVPSVALVEGADEPFVLGRLVSLGREEDGDVVLRGAAGAAPPEGTQLPARARLFTGSGEPGLPSGLVLGDALVGAADERGERTVRLARPHSPRDLRRAWVRLDAGPGAGGAEDAP